MMFEWSDLRFFLAVARTGSTVAAAQSCGVSQSTVARRMAALESALSLKLFERLQTGSVLTSDGRSLLCAAEDAEASIVAVENKARSVRRELTGVVRFTTPPEGADPVIGLALAAFMERHPAVRIELLTTERFLDIAKGEADVALRAGPMPTAPELVVRKVAEVIWAGYCTSELSAQVGSVAAQGGWATSRVIGADGQLSGAPVFRWLDERASTIVARVSTISGMLGLAKAGAGIAFLPVRIGDSEPRLVRCHPPILEAGSPIWIVTREDARRTAHVRAFIDFLSAQIAAAAVVLRRELAGKGWF